MLLGAVSITIALILTGYKSLFIRFIADEYCHAYIAHNKTFWDAQLYWYYAWTGKYSYNFFVTLVQLLGLRIFPFIPIFVLIIWMISLYWTLSEFAELLKIKISKAYILYISEVIIFIHFWSMPTIGQSFYWQSAAPYTIPLVLLTINTGVIARAFQYKSFNLTLSCIAFIIAFIAGGFSETFAAMQMTLCIIAIFFVVRYVPIYNKRKFLLFLFTIALGASLSLFLIAVAPGNKARQALYPPPENAFIPLVLSIMFSLYYVLISISSFIGGLFIAPLAEYVLNAGNKAQVFLKIIRNNIAIISLLVFILILSCVAPNFFSISTPPFGRNLAIPNFIFVIYSVLLGLIFGNDLLKRSRPILGIIVLFSLTLIPVSYSYRLAKELPQYKLFASKWDEQNRSILNQKKMGKKDITISALGQTEGLEDVQKNSHHWINICMSQYYGIHSVTAK